MIGLFDTDSLDDFGLIESEDKDCEDGEVGSYLPEVVLPDLDPVEELRLTEEDTLVVGPAPFNGRYSSTAIILLLFS